MGKKAGAQCGVCGEWFWDEDATEAYNKCTNHEMAKHGYDSEDVDDD